MLFVLGNFFSLPRGDLVVLFQNFGTFTLELTTYSSIFSKTDNLHILLFPVATSFHFYLKNHEVLRVYFHYSLLSDTKILFMLITKMVLYWEALLRMGTTVERIFSFQFSLLNEFFGA